ncbi:PREDICTED: uncharacterized protein LOC109473506 [Branchiostoma belcheri]|uniref:Uncharacterized protein LOC109473506 n=1 Tax=Branchiostoma belcheri TaxID=7741 RepID=A0A6P4ZH31_BRABE|nr:PREDICTED: uncharacterized protein LOC109473506 [Branchiostoma belcheri]
MGDFNEDAPNFSAIANANMNRNSTKGVIAPMHFYGVPDIVVNTPSLEHSSPPLVFGPKQVGMAFLMPHLYDVAGFKETLNTNLVRAIEFGTTPMASITETRRDELVAARDYNKLYKAYVMYEENGVAQHQMAESAQQKLESLEKFPFCDVRAKIDEVTGKHVFDVVLRDVIGQVPAFVIRSKGHALRGERLMAEANNQNTQQEYIGKLESVMKRGGLPIDGPSGGKVEMANDEGVTEYYVGLLQQLYGKHSDKLNEVNALACDPAKLKESIWTHAVRPVITGMRYNLGDETLGASIPDIFALENMELPKANEDDNPQTYGCVLASNIFKMALNNEIAPHIRIASIIMMFRRIKPVAFAEDAESRTPVGWAVDMVRLQEIYSDTAIFGKPLSHEMLVSGAEASEKPKDDGNVCCELSMNVQTMHSMYAGGAVVATCIYPNPHMTTLAAHRGKPIVSMDSISRSKTGYLQKEVERIGKDNFFSDNDREAIDRYLGAQEKVRIATASMGGENRSFNLSDEFVPIIRPAGKPNHDPIDIMGRPRGEAFPLSGTTDIPLVKFNTSSIPTTNPYATSMDSLYQHLFRANNAPVGSNSTPYRAVTGNYRTERSTFPVSATTEVLEHLFAMDNSMNCNIMPEGQIAATSNFAAVKGWLKGVQLNYDKGTTKPEHALVSKFDIGVYHAKGVPYTQYTDDGGIKGVKREGFCDSGRMVPGSGPYSMYIQSPYSIPV